MTGYCSKGRDLHQRYDWFITTSVLWGRMQGSPVVTQQLDYPPFFRPFNFLSRQTRLPVPFVNWINGVREEELLIVFLLYWKLTVTMPQQWPDAMPRYQSEDAGNDIVFGRSGKIHLPIFMLCCGSMAERPNPSVLNNRESQNNITSSIAFLFLSVTQICCR